MPYTILTFYRFAPLPDWRALKAPLQALAEPLGVRGTVLLAEEGVNGTLAGAPAALDAVLAWLQQVPGLAGLQGQASEADFLPFDRLKIRLKAEIVALKRPADPRRRVGAYVSPADWDRWLTDPEAVVLDTRNRAEVALGTFRGALDPNTETFADFPRYIERSGLSKDQPVALFCTGGIRCEKATSYLLDQGFQHVFHLQGGILNYLRQVPVERSSWQGECFVFDQRFAVDHHLRPRYADAATARRHLGEGWSLSPAPR